MSMQIIAAQPASSYQEQEAPPGSRPTGASLDFIEVQGAHGSRQAPRRCAAAGSAQCSPSRLACEALAEKSFLSRAQVRTDATYPAGFMDVIEIAKTGEAFRLVYDTKVCLRNQPIRPLPVKSLPAG